MARTIPELIAAAYAGESLTSAEARRLARYKRHADHIETILMRTVSPEDLARSETMSMAEAFAECRKMLLRNLRNYTVGELRGYIRQLLVLLGQFVEMSAAREGITRRRQRERHRAGRTSGASRRQNAADFLAAIDDLKRANPSLTDRAAVRRYLVDRPSWGTATEVERKIKFTLERLRQNRKKRSQSN